MAASLAAGGFEAPRTVIEGEFGFLEVFCTEWDESHLTRGLGSDFVTLSTVLKRYPCHATAHPAVKAVRDLQAEHGFTGGDIAGRARRRRTEEHAPRESGHSLRRSRPCRPRGACRRS